MFEALESYAQQIIEFIRIHQPWAAPVVFMLAFGESLAFISLLLPAWAALVSMGALIAAGELNFWANLGAAPIGAALRDRGSFLVGREVRNRRSAHFAPVRPP